MFTRLTLVEEQEHGARAPKDAATSSPLSHTFRHGPADSARAIRAAASNDIESILLLVNDHARRGDLLPRTARSIGDTLPDWLVGERDGQIVACVSLLPYTPELAEVRSLAVADSAKGQGWGQAIVQALIVEAERRQFPTLFALTRAVRFFQKAGFTITSKDMFPEKVWRDCAICPIRQRCDETAVVLQLSSGRLV